MIKLFNIDGLSTGFVIINDKLKLIAYPWNTLSQLPNMAGWC